MTRPLPKVWEAALREVVYATVCRYEGHESSCNVYGCTRHGHPEVKAIRRVLRKLYGRRNVEDISVCDHGNDDTVCCRECGRHSMPHVGCILR